jgi:hypothetical protein
MNYNLAIAYQHDANYQALMLLGYQDLSQSNE